MAGDRVLCRGVKDGGNRVARSSPPYNVAWDGLQTDTGRQVMESKGGCGVAHAPRLNLKGGEGPEGLTVMCIVAVFLSPGSPLRDGWQSVGTGDGRLD